MSVPSVPDWLATDFLQSCLQSKEGHPITVLSHTVEPGVAEGNNYASQLLRVKVDYRKGDLQSSISLIVKGPLASIEEVLLSYYGKETNFYSKFIEETFKYCKHDIVPKYYVSPIQNCVVLEDLSSSGYVMVDRYNLLDFDHCELFIKSKAKLHALSIAVYKDNPQIIDSVMKESLTDVENNHKIFKASVNGSFQCMAEYLKDKPTYKRCLNVIKATSVNGILWKIVEEMEKSNSNKPLKAVIQLDPWCPNMMFKYDSLGRVKSIKLLDFQNLAFTTPVKEIVIFLTVSPNLEVRKTKLKSLYRLYCDELNKNLAEFGCPDRLNFEDMEDEIVAMSPLILMNICEFLPLVLAEEAVDYSEFFTDNISNASIVNSAIKKLFQGIHFNKVYPEIFDLITKDGVFDYLEEKIKQIKL